MIAISRTRAIQIIHGKRKGLGWDNDYFHEILDEMDYDPPKLSLMDEKQLSDLITDLSIIAGDVKIRRFFVRPDGRTAKVHYLYHFARQAGFDRKRLHRLVAASPYKKKKLEDLTDDEYKGVVATLKNYKRKLNKERR